MSPIVKKFAIKNLILLLPIWFWSQFLPWEQVGLYASRLYQVIYAVIFITFLVGSGILFNEQAMTRLVAVSRLILWPIETYIGFGASFEVLTALIESINNAAHACNQPLLVTYSSPYFTRVSFQVKRVSLLL